MRLLLDSGVLGKLCHPANPENRRVIDWLERFLASGIHSLILPEITDYELRRELLHLVRRRRIRRESLQRLDNLVEVLEYYPLDTGTMRLAADLWANARYRGQPTTADESLDADVILAAQAIQAQGVIVTTNRKHLSRFTPTKSLDEIMHSSAVTPPSTCRSARMCSATCRRTFSKRSPVYRLSGNGVQFTPYAPARAS